MSRSMRLGKFSIQDESKQMHFLALSVIYFLSVLMVSNYRDALEPDNKNVSLATLKIASNSESVLKIPRPAHETSTKVTTESPINCTSQNTDNGYDNPISTIDLPLDIGNSISNEIKYLENNVSHPISLTTGQLSLESKIDEESTGSVHEQMENIELVPSTSTTPDDGFEEINEKKKIISDQITNRLEKSLSTSVPFLRELLLDFFPYLSKTLLGSHGQELLASSLVVINNTQSIIELVMLLCSQQWQNSLQKNAGMAFIELVNEGRLLMHASRDHLLRVALEAMNIVSRLETTEIEAHARFEQLCGQALAEHREEDRLCNQLMTQNHQDSEEIVQQLFQRLERKEKILNAKIDIDQITVSTNQISNSSYIGECLTSGGFDYECNFDYFRLDSWEDDSRRRRRLVPNLFGSSHSNAIHDLSINNIDTSNTHVNGQKLQEAIEIAKNSFPIVEECSKGDSNEANLSESLDCSHANQMQLNDAEPSGDERRFSITSDNFKDDSTSSRLPMNIKTLSSTYVNYHNRIPDETPVVFSTNCNLITNALRVYGVLSISRAEVYFEWLADHPLNAQLDSKSLSYVEHLQARWSFQEIRAIFSRRHLHRQVALELFMSSRNAVLFAFNSTEEMHKVLANLPPVGIGMKYHITQSRNSSLASPKQLFDQSAMTKKWQNREMTNFDYIMYLNTIAGRSYNDLNQYPIFPWVLSDYKSEELDLANMASYRDLSKPIGALNPMRKEFFDQRYREWDDETQPAFHYGTHYSTSAFVLSYLIRLEPFSTIFLNLQGGRFDNPNRLFHSIVRTWENCQLSSSDVKELIPEFFYLPEMFRNDNKYNMGVTDDGVEVDDVVLPPWAKTPEEFVNLHRQALESEFVSSQLHHWIDLIFGYKQRGPEAVKATNVFCYLTYEDCIDFSKITDPMLIEALKNQIQSFGQTPSQLLTCQHPARNSALHISPQIFRPIVKELCMVLKCPSNSPLIHLECNTAPTNRFTNSQSSLSSCVVTVSQNLLFGLHRWSLAAADILCQQSEEKDHIDHQNHDTPILPLSLDPMLQTSNGCTKRFLGDSFGLEEQNFAPGDSCHFVVAPDNRSIIVAGYIDNSIRVYALESGRVTQIIRGAHSGPICCLARSECCGGGINFYLATGGRDSLIMLWPFDLSAHLVLGEFTNETPVPHAILEGHVSTISCISVSSELGLVISGSEDCILLLHTIRGELLRRLDLLVVRELAARKTNFPRLHPNQLIYSREGHIVALYSRNLLALYSLNGRLLRCATVHDIIPNLQPAISQNFSMAISSNVEINCITISRCGFYLVCGDTNGFAWCIRTLTFERIHLFPRCSASIRCLDLTNDQKFLIAGLESGCMVVFHIDFNKWHPEFLNRYESIRTPIVKSQLKEKINSLEDGIKDEDIAETSI